MSSLCSSRVYTGAASPASSDAVRPRVSGIHIPGSTLVRTRLTAEEVERLAPSPPQPSLVFHPDCREILETPSKWGIDRNVGFDADVVVPSVDRDVQVDGRGEVVTALPMPMPECVRGIGWAEQVWADASRPDPANSSKL